MVPDRRATLRVLLAVTDVTVLVLLWAIAPDLRDAVVAVWPFDLVPGPVPVLRAVDHELARAAGVVVVGGWLAVLAARGRYRRPERSEGAAAVVLSALMATGAVFALLYLVKLPHLSRSLLLGFAVLTVPALGLSRRWVQQLARLPVGDPMRVAVLGPPVALDAFAGEVAAHPEWRTVVAARVSSDQVDAIVALTAAVARTPIDEVRLVGTTHHVAQVADLASLCAEMGMALTVDVDVWGVRAHGVDAAGGGVTFRYSPEHAPGMRIKRMVDVVGASVALILVAPVIAALAVMVKLVDGGPAFFVQERAGLHGRTFRMWKLRSMVPGAQEQLAELHDRNEVAGPAFKMMADPRVTALGRVLRRTSLDELPQLVHVLTGQMSLVGPRPPIPEEVRDYTRAQRRRLSMRPGMTGLWQVSGRSALPFDAWLALDLDYIDRWSLALDATVLLRTIPAVLSGRGAW